MDFKSTLSQLLLNGFLTGSQAFGTAKESSDWDIVYPVYWSDKINNILLDLERVPSDYFSGYTVRVDNRVINLIPVHPHEFMPWFLATRAMRETLKTSGIVDPIKKYAVFMSIVSAYKGTVEQLGTVSHYMDQAREILMKSYSDNADMLISLYIQ